MIKYTILTFLIVFSFFVAFSAAYSESVFFKVDILEGESTQEILKIEVPDQIFLGQVLVGDIGEEQRVWINNTGNIDIVVTPRLADQSEKFLSNLYFRAQKTKTINGTSTNVAFDKIGDFSFDIAKPSTKSFNDEDFYVVLNLTDYSEDIDSDILGHEAEVMFIVAAK